MIKMNELRDISDINIDISQPLEKRQEQFVEQIKNPYLFTCNGLLVKLEFNGESSFADKIISHIEKTDKKIV